MMCNALLKQIDKADRVFAELGGITDMVVQLDKKDLQTQLMHVTNGQNIETGLKIRWSDSVRGNLTIVSNSDLG